MNSTQPEPMYVKLAPPFASTAALWSDTGETEEKTKGLDSETETMTRRELAAQLSSLR